MTMEDAVFYIMELQKTYASMDKKVAEAVDMAIEALKDVHNCVHCEHYTEVETDTGIHGECKMDTAHRGDLISRQDAIDAIEQKAYRHTYLDQIIDIVKSLPSAEPRYTGCSGCVHYDQQQTALICHDCKRSYRDRYEDGEESE